MPKEKKENYINIQFNESELLRRYFSLSSLPKKNRDNIYKIMFINNTNIKVIKVVLKYLLIVEKIHPKKVEQLIFKWCVLVSYYYFKSVYYYDVSIPEFDEILVGDITVQKLEKLNVTSNEIYASLVNNDRKLRDTDSNIKKLCSHLETYQGNNKKDSKIENEINSEKINSLLKNDNYFFTTHNGRKYLFNIEFNPNNHRSSFDRLISSVLADDNSLVLFDLKINENELDNISKNYNLFKGKEKLGPNAIEKSVPVVFGYMLTCMINERNIDFSKKIKTLPESLFFIYLDQAKCKFNVNSFLYQKNGYVVEKEKINKCEFILNNIKYQFSCEGIREINNK